MSLEQLQKEENNQSSLFNGELAVNKFLKENEKQHGVE